MNRVRSIISGGLSRFHTQIVSPYRLRRLLQEPDEPLRSIGIALASARSRQLSQEERLYIGRIEALRQQLEASSSTIAVEDHGTGLPNAARMVSGKIATREIGELCRRTSVSHPWGLLLFHLIRELRPLVCLELGACLGISAAYQAAALKLNSSGVLISLEGSESLAVIAGDHLRRLELDNAEVVIGRFQDHLDEVLLRQGKVDFVFIDGHHEERSTLAYVEKILPFLSEEGVFVLDDISWSRGMRRAWAAIRSDHRFMILLDLFRMGLCSPSTFRRKKVSLRLGFR